MAKHIVSWPKIPVFAIAAGLLATPALASIEFHILPATMVQQPGDSILVELTVVNESDEFNGYDAQVTYDPERLLFLRMTPVTLQEGPLMTEACPTRFHVFSIAPDSTYVQVAHVLLCAGVTVTGPGVVYRLRFQCRDLEGETALGFGPATAFYDAGYYVTPLNLQGAVVTIGGSTAAPHAPPPAVRLTAAPNPFNPRTTLTFDLPAAAAARLAIHDAAGRLVRVLSDGPLAAGAHRAAWDGRDDAGRSLPAGTYFARVDAGAFSRTCKMVLVK